MVFRAAEYWGKMFKGFHDTVAIDGAWIDMNEGGNCTFSARKFVPLKTRISYRKNFFFFTHLKISE